MRIRPALLAMVCALSLAGCGDRQAPNEPPPPNNNEIPPPPDVKCSEWGEICPITLATYDGSGQVVHPDIVLAPNTWPTRYWLAVTPYRGGSAMYENPSIFTDGAERGWVVPLNVTNPIVERPTSGYNSDPDIVFNPRTQELWYYFRTTVGGRDVISLTTSSDGSVWSTPQEVVSASGIAIISPTIVRQPRGEWRMWSVNAINGGCRTTAATVEQRTSDDGVHWSAPAPVALVQPDYVVWHFDVQYIASLDEYWTVYAAYPKGSGCAATDLFFARSRDGTHWTTYPSPLVARGEFAPFQDAVYRSTFLYDPASNALRVWMSGAAFSNGWTWSTATARWQVASLADRLSVVRRTFSAITVPTVWDERGDEASASNFP